MVRSLVISPHEDMRTWLKYASLCGKSGRLVSTVTFCIKALSILLSMSEPITYRRIKPELIKSVLSDRKGTSSS